MSTAADAAAVAVGVALFALIASELVAYVTRDRRRRPPD
jgi:hypothetical protein